MPSRNQVHAKRLYGFLPVVKGHSSFKSRVEVRQFRRTFFNQGMGNLVAPIRSKRYGVTVSVLGQGICSVRVHREDGHVNSSVNSSGVLCMPRVPFIVCDEKELSMFTGIYSSSKAARPCNMCLCSFEQHGIETIGAERTIAQMMQVRIRFFVCVLM